MHGLPVWYVCGHFTYTNSFSTAAPKVGSLVILTPQTRESKGPSVTQLVHIYRVSTGQSLGLTPGCLMPASTSLTSEGTVFHAEVGEVRIVLALARE